jgi:hypothetical protein
MLDEAKCGVKSRRWARGAKRYAALAHPVRPRRPETALAFLGVVESGDRVGQPAGSDFLRRAVAVEGNRHAPLLEEQTQLQSGEAGADDSDVAYGGLPVSISMNN